MIFVEGNIMKLDIISYQDTKALQSKLAVCGIVIGYILNDAMMKCHLFLSSFHC